MSSDGRRERARAAAAERGETLIGDRPCRTCREAGRGKVTLFEHCTIHWPGCCPGQCPGPARGPGGNHGGGRPRKGV